MFYTANASVTAPAYPSVEGPNPAAPTQYVAKHKPDPRQLKAFKFNQQRVFALDGNKLLLRLRETPTLLVDRATMTFEVEHWDIRLPIADVADVPRQICRRFLELFSKTERQTASLDEQRAWLRILDQVDYRQFYADRAAPRYEEATLIRKTPICLVEWPDGQRERLPSAAAFALYPLNDGDRFSVFVIFDRHIKLLWIDRVVLVVALDQ